ncbi:MAG: hypothetical protein U0P46_01475 [Holophagaceae bacterium]
MRKPMLALLALPLVLACTRPASELLRQQPHPTLYLELALPDQPEAAVMKQAYGAAFRDHFAKGLGDPEAARPDRVQLLVVVGNRLVRTEAEARLNSGVDQAGAIASGSPVRLLLSTVGPKSAYESQVERLGYRPGLLSGQIAVLRVGKDGFQETLKLDPMAIVKRMRPLGESDRNLAGILAEEGRALALESLALLQKQVGWEPPPA